MLLNFIKVIFVSDQLHYRMNPKNTIHTLLFTVNKNDSPATAQKVRTINRRPERRYVKDPMLCQRIV